MEAKKQRYQYNNYSYEGNTARKLNLVPDYDTGEAERRKKQPVREVRKRPRMNTGMDLFALFFLSIAMIVTLYTCIDYLQVQMSVSSMNKEVAQLEHSLTKLQNDNKAAMAELNASLDLNYIYKIATTQLGMVYPNNNQVITYQSNVSDYVRQYKEIPEENKTSILDKITK